MSFVLLTEDEHATLEAALAFLDSCSSDAEQLDASPHSSPCGDDGFLDLSATFSSQDSDSSPTSDLQLSTDHQSDSSTSAVHKKATTSALQKPRRVPSVASRPRKRRIHEIFELRERVVQLRARLNRLQERRGVDVEPGRAQASHHTPLSDTLQAHPKSECVFSITKKALASCNAVQELEKLHESEAENRRLRAAWKQQIKLAKRLENLIEKQLAPMDVESHLEAECQQLMPTSARDNNSVTWDATRIMGELHRYLEPLDLHTASISASISLRDTSRVFSSSQVYHDMVLGEMYEVTTNTPLVCGLRELDEHIRYALTSSKVAPRKPHTESHVTPRLEHQFTKSFDCQFGEILVSGVSVGRKVEEPHQIVLAYTSMLAFPGTEIAFRETGWLMMTEPNGGTGESKRKSSSSSPQHVLLQTCCRIHLAISSDAAASRSPSSLENAEYFKNFVLQSQCEEMRAKQLRIQTAALQKFGLA